jgi:hypothetical protein
MNAPVDVLAVLDAEIDHGRNHTVGGRYMGHLLKVRGAIAELIAADRWFDAVQNGGQDERHMASLRRADALARCTGGDK